MPGSNSKHRRQRKLPMLLRVKLTLRAIREIMYLPLISFEPVPIAIPFPLMTLFDDVSRSRQTIDSKIREANDSLGRTMDVIDELRNLLKEKTAELAVLKTESEKYAKLASVEKRKARAVIEEVEQSLAKRKGRERLERLVISVVAGLIVFVLGILLGPGIRSFLGLH